MPAIEDTNDKVYREPPSQIQIAAPTYRGITVDTRYTPVSALMSHVEGSSWTVNYYSQLLNDDSPLVGQSVTRSPIYQQYTLIKKMEFKVTQPLNDQEQDSESKQMILTGGATIYPFLIPNVGDMFLADIGDGKEGLFQVKTVDRKRIYEDTCHTITYQLIDDVSLSAVRREDLVSKTINTLVYIRNFLQHGQNPLVQEEEYHLISNLENKFKIIADEYFDDFFSNEYSTLLIPGQELPTYDVFLTNAVLSYVTTYDTPNVRRVKQYNVSDDPAMDIDTIWTAIAKRRRSLLKRGMRKHGLVYARQFTLDPMVEGIFHTGVTYVVYPKDADIEANYQTWYRPKTLVEAVLTNRRARMPQLSDLISETNLGKVSEDVVPLIHPIVGHDHYVFSKAFYERAPGQSRIELLVQDYLDSKAINIRQLYQLVEACENWDDLERFYYIPILLVLVKTTIRSF